MKLVLKNVIKLAKGSLNNIFQDSFNKILSQQLTHEKSYVSLVKSAESELCGYRLKSCTRKRLCGGSIFRQDIANLIPPSHQNRSHSVPKNFLDA